jgi:hypothetical protein
MLALSLSGNFLTRYNLETTPQINYLYQNQRRPKMKRLLATLAILTAATVTHAQLLPPLTHTIEGGLQQGQELVDMEIEQGANLEYRVRIQDSGRWLPLAGLTAEWQARETATDTNAYVAVSVETVTNVTPNYFRIPMSSIQTGTPITNWVYSVVVKQGTDQVPLGKGRVDINASAWTGAAGIMRNVTSAAYTDAAIELHAQETDVHGIPEIWQAIEDIGAPDWTDILNIPSPITDFAEAMNQNVATTSNVAFAGVTIGGTNVMTELAGKQPAGAYLTTVDTDSTIDGDGAGVPLSVASNIVAGAAAGSTAVQPATLAGYVETNHFGPVVIKGDFTAGAGDTSVMVAEGFPSESANIMYSRNIDAEIYDPYTGSNPDFSITWFDGRWEIWAEGGERLYRATSQNITPNLSDDWEQGSDQSEPGEPVSGTVTAGPTLSATGSTVRVHTDLQVDGSLMVDGTNVIAELDGKQPSGDYVTQDDPTYLDTVDLAASSVQTNHQGNVVITGDFTAGAGDTNVMVASGFAATAANGNYNYLFTDTIGLGFEGLYVIPTEDGFSWHFRKLNNKWDLWFEQDLEYESSGEDVEFPHLATWADGTVTAGPTLSATGSTVRVHTDLTVDGFISGKYSPRRIPHPLAYADPLTVSPDHISQSVTNAISGPMTITWPAGEAAYDQIISLTIPATTNTVTMGSTNFVSYVFIATLSEGGGNVSTNYPTVIDWRSLPGSTNAQAIVS